jgi:phosphohistidine phosphatase
MLKTLWVMRHGLAVDQFDSDFTRALSKTGKVQAENIGEQLLKDCDELPQRMLVSPFRRTQETAQIVHAALKLKDPFETEDMLVHFGDPRLLGDYLLSLNEERVMIVSHMPIVAQLCEYLAPGCGVYGFQTAQVVKLNAATSTTLAFAKSFLAGR